MCDMGYEDEEEDDDNNNTNNNDDDHDDGGGGGGGDDDDDDNGGDHVPQQQHTITRERILEQEEVEAQIKRTTNTDKSSPMRLKTETHIQKNSLWDIISLVV